jgi:hypothetical protein
VRSRLLNGYEVAFRTASAVDDQGFFAVDWLFELFDRDGEFVESSNGFSTKENAERAASDAAIQHAFEHRTAAEHERRRVNAMAGERLNNGYLITVYSRALEWCVKVIDRDGNDVDTMTGYKTYKAATDAGTTKALEHDIASKREARKEQTT